MVRLNEAVRPNIKNFVSSILASSGGYVSHLSFHFQKSVLDLLTILESCFFFLCFSDVRGHRLKGQPCSPSVAAPLPSPRFGFGLPPRSLNLLPNQDIRSESF